jgi:hypothetical protein
MGRLNAKELAIANAGFASKSSSGCSLGAAVVVVGSLLMLRGVVVFTVVVRVVVRGRVVVAPNNGSRSVLVAMFGVP